ncbi:hypothetical protein G134_230 [Lactobacillus delbrueckii subsp. lactis CRL581]|nr:hypothetical protein G134_230 [Lactobacillus delbrueckii subsp. lactis CRL581]
MTTKALPLFRSSLAFLGQHGISGLPSLLSRNTRLAFSCSIFSPFP